MLKSALRFAAGTASLATRRLGTACAVNDEHTRLASARDPVRCGPVDRSPNYRDGVFHNLEPSSALRLDAEENRLVLLDVFSRAQQPSAGHRWLADPPPASSGPEPLAVAGSAARPRWWRSTAAGCSSIRSGGERCSPSRAVGPQRLDPAAVALAAVPALDAVVISHDHYDHLEPDHRARCRRRTQRAPLIARLGIGGRLAHGACRRRGSSKSTGTRSSRTGELSLVCTPAPRASGRNPSRNPTLWAASADHRSTASRLLRRRHRIHPQLGPDWRRPRPFRPDADAHRGLQQGLARHPHDPRGSRGRPTVTSPTAGCSGDRPIHWCTSGWRRTPGRSPSSGC